MSLVQQGTAAGTAEIQQQQATAAIESSKRPCQLQPYYKVPTTCACSWYSVHFLPRTWVSLMTIFQANHRLICLHKPYCKVRHTLQPPAGSAT
jgi:hypothetical protein